MESFYNIHYHLLEHIGNPVRRSLANEIDWSHNLIGIKGSRGIGKTTFLLQFALEKFGKSRSCLYIDMNNFYFCGRRLVDFAGEFHNNGGRVLGVTARAESLQAALDKAYANVDEIHFEDCFSRRDIGKRALSAKND